MQKLPSIHNAYWEPLWKAIVEHDIAICLHIGAGNPAPHASMETPIEAWISTMPMSIVVGAADWLHLEALERYPSMKIALSEGGIGWIPYFLERSDFSHERHKAWTHSRFEGTKPSEVFRKHFLTCFIDDAFGLQNLRSHRRGHGRLRMRLSAFGFTVAESAGNAVGERQAFDRAADRQGHASQRDALLQLRSVQASQARGAHRRSLAEAKAAGGGRLTVHSYGGAAPLLPGEKPRPITSGDVMEMYNRHRKTASKAA